MTSRVLVLTINLWCVSLGAPVPPMLTLAEVPATVIQEMQVRGCKAPGKKPKNVISGEFFKPGQVDWAVLCITRKQASLVVFPNGAREQAEVIENQSRNFSGWSIDTVPKAQLNDLHAIWRTRAANVGDFNHDGVGSYVEYGDKNAKCLYCSSAGGKTFYRSADGWAVVSGMIVN